MQPNVAVRGISMRIVDTIKTSPIGIASEVAKPKLVRPSTYGAKPASLAPPSTSRNTPTNPVRIQPIMRMVLLEVVASGTRVSTTGLPHAASNVILVVEMVRRLERIGCRWKLVSGLQSGPSNRGWRFVFNLFVQDVKPVGSVR